MRCSPCQPPCSPRRPPPRTPRRSPTPCSTRVLWCAALFAALLSLERLFAADYEDGSLDLLLTLPITRKELILGKYAGLAGALAFSTIAGFGAVGVIVASSR